MDPLLTRMMFLLVTTIAAGAAGSVEVHFENKDGGFFLKHTAKQPYSDLGNGVAVGGSGSQLGAAAGGGSQQLQLSVDRFTVFETSQPMSVRATYGPFSTKQTVPARYIVPDPVPFNANTSNALFAEVDHHLDMSAHMVRGEVPRDSPVVRVLFHAGADSLSLGLGVGVGVGARGGRQPVCIVLHVHAPPNAVGAAGGKQLSASCSPDGEDGVCLAEVVLPASWWPPLPPPDEKPVKSPPRLAKVSYSVIEPRGSECVPRVQIAGVTWLGAVALTAAKAGYRELRQDPHLRILVPHTPLYPRSTAHFPVFFYHQPNDNISGFILRARVKSGVKVLGAEASLNDAWNVSVDLNPKLTVATVMAFRRKGLESITPPRAEEVLTFQVQVLDEGADLWDEGRLVWTVRYLTDAANVNTPNSRRSREHHASVNGPIAHQHHASVNAPVTRQHHNLRPQRDDEARRKITARLEVHKDDIQAVLPISKNWEVMNTAVLTGRQVSQAMKVFIVSQAGKVADVTLQSSCHSEDESILKVSSSCSSVYVDGSEIRGSWNASVLVKYGTYTGLAQFKVWMPEFPLEVNVNDFRLSQVKGWRVPDQQPRTHGKMKRSVDDSLIDEQRWDEMEGEGEGNNNNNNAMITEDVGNAVDEDKSLPCKLRFQQSPVEVYARFLAADHDSGRVSYFVSRRTWLRVTDLVMTLLRISDPRIASLHGQIVQGRSIGRTEVQVLSAISGRVIGAKEVRVGVDKVALTRMRVEVVSGLQLNILPDTAIDNGYIAQTSVTRKLTAQYQEGLLDIYLEFSDGTQLPLRDVPASDYQLVVDSLNPEVVAFAPMLASSSSSSSSSSASSSASAAASSSPAPHPRVIAVGQGKGELLRVALLVTETCRAPTKRTTPLLTNTAQVQVDFASSSLQHRPDFVQNDGGASASAGIPLKDDNNHEPTVQARQHQGSGAPSGGNVNLVSMGMGQTKARHYGAASLRMTPLEIGMYVLLAAFCFAIVVFVVSCVVYASKFKPQVPAPYFPGSPLDSPPESSIPMMLPGGAMMNGGMGMGGVTSSAHRHLRQQQQQQLHHLATAQQHHMATSQLQEPTTNAHDWVWLGRTTLERTSGLLVPASAVNHNNNNNNNNMHAHRAMRITANPGYPVATNQLPHLLHQSATPHDYVGGNLNNVSPNHHSPMLLASPLHHQSAATYCKERPSRLPKNNHDASENLWKILPPPPPLPPHRGGTRGGGAGDHHHNHNQQQQQQLQLDVNDPDYRPPVPPHRNIGVTAKMAAVVAADDVTSPRGGGGGRRHHHHHHHHHHRNNSNGGVGAKSGSSSRSPHHRNVVHVHASHAEDEAAILEPEVEGEGEGEADNFRFTSTMESGGNELVKRATIVGNPMFSQEENGVEGEDDEFGENGGRPRSKEELLALEDLNLGMDYQQIMEYFDNLKESNA